VSLQREQRRVAGVFAQTEQESDICIEVEGQAEARLQLILKRKPWTRVRLHSLAIDVDLPEMS
jgi:hypothetical protein